jgi:hypothetical protein
MVKNHQGDAIDAENVVNKRSSNKTIFPKFTALHDDERARRNQFIPRVTE